MNRSFSKARTAALFYAAIYAGAASAGPIDLGVPGLDMRWDNTLRFTTGIRLDKPDPAVAGNQNYDESEAKFGKGDITNARFDLLSELDGSYTVGGSRIGARVSGAGWYDPAYSDTVKFNPAITQSEGTTPDGAHYNTSYNGDHYSSYTRKYYMHGGELLDAFVFANTQIASMPVSIKVGRLSQYWGESLFSAGQSVSYGQQPIDGLKASVSPGIETKEVFMPLTQIALTMQPVSDLSLSAQYFLEWKPMRLPQGGTFFGAADFLSDGPDRMPLAPAGSAMGLNMLPDCSAVITDNCHVPGTPAFTDNARRLSPNRPGNSGDYGLSARWSPEWAKGPIALYYRYFDERSPWAGINFPQQDIAVAVISSKGGIVGVPGAYQLVYPKNTRLYGMSYSTNIGQVSVGSEATYRYHTALNNGFPSTLSGSSFGSNGEGPRGNLVTALANTIVLLPSTPLYNTGTITAEVAWSHLVAVTENKDNYSGVGYAGCNPTGRPGGAAGSRADGCSTRDYVGAQINIEPQWLQVLPGLDLSMPLSYFDALHGNKQDNGDGFQGEQRWSTGLTGDLFQKYKATLSYSDSWAHHGAGQPSSLNDRGWLSLTFKTTF